MRVRDEEDVQAMDDQRRRQDETQMEYQHAEAQSSLAGNNEEAAAAEQQGQPVMRDAPKVGRNDPCPCGSGKKYKHCHGQLS